MKFWSTWSGAGIWRSSSAPPPFLRQTCECLTTHSRGSKCPSCDILSSEKLALIQTSSWPDLGLWPKDPCAEVAHLGWERGNISLLTPFLWLSETWEAWNTGIKTWGRCRGEQTLGGGQILMENLSWPSYLGGTSAYIWYFEHARDSKLLKADD